MSGADCSANTRGRVGAAVSTVALVAAEWGEAIAAARRHRAAWAPEHVTTIQRFANDLGVPLTVDGRHGPHTARFTIMFQRSFQLAEYRSRPLLADGLPGPATIEAAELCADQSFRVTPHFRYAEYATRNPDRRVTALNPVLCLDRDLAALMQAVRMHFDSPVRVVSGFRDRRWNTVIGGATASQHMLGKAADFSIASGESLSLAVARTLGAGGVGIEPGGRVSHVDVRSTPAHWYYRR